MRASGSLLLLHSQVHALLQQMLFMGLPLHMDIE